MFWFFVGILIIIAIPLAIRTTYTENEEKRKRKELSTFNMMSLREATEYLEKNEFDISKTIEGEGAIFCIDDTRKLWCVVDDTSRTTTFGYEDILDYEVFANEHSIMKGSQGDALVGGLLFGAAGAVIGASGDKKEQKICNSIVVGITVNSLHHNRRDVPFLTTPVDMSSSEYTAATDGARQLISTLHYMQHNAPEQRGEQKCELLLVPKKTAEIEAVKKCRQCGKYKKKMWFSSTGLCEKCAWTVYNALSEEERLAAKLPKNL